MNQINFDKSKFKELLNKHNLIPTTKNDNNLNYSIDSKKLNLKPTTEKYYILIVNKSFPQIVLNQLLSFYYNLVDSEKFIGIDFEFNTKIVALMQLCLEWHSDYSIVFILYPPNLEKDNLDLLKKILLDKQIPKFLHGAESLDIPYLFNDFFEQSNDFYIFLENFIDSKYLCEYYLITNKIDHKCKIYSLFRLLGLIDDKIEKVIKANEEEMGPIYNIIIDIEKLTPSLLKYSVFDVIYLNSVYKFFHNKENIKQSTNINKITRFMIQQKYSKQFEEMRAKLNKMNNFYLPQYGMLRLSEIFIICNGIYDDETYKNLHKINNFKFILETIIMHSLYKLLFKFNLIYQKKNDRKYFDLPDLNLQPPVGNDYILFLFRKINNWLYHYFNSN